MRALRKGEYDLVNISLIGFDPKTGRSYEECHAEWSVEKDRVLQIWASLKWWQIAQNVKCRWQIMVLTERLGM